MSRRRASLLSEFPDVILARTSRLPAIAARVWRAARFIGRRCGAGADRKADCAIVRSGIVTTGESRTGLGTSAASKTIDFPGLPGSAGVGTHGGSEDHTAILTGKTGSRQPVSPVLCHRWATRRCRRLDTVIASMVQADKAGSALVATTAPPMAARASCDLESPRASAATSLADVRWRRAIDRLKSWLAPTADGAFSSADSNGVSNTSRETARRAAAAFANGDRDRLEPRLIHNARRRTARQPDPPKPSRWRHWRARSAPLPRAASALGWRSVGPWSRRRRAAFGEWVRAYARRMPAPAPFRGSSARPVRPRLMFHG
jgi:hypothetical protein